MALTIVISFLLTNHSTNTNQSSTDNLFQDSSVQKALMESRKRRKYNRTASPEYTLRKKQDSEYRIVTINGYDAATNTTIDPLNLWSDYQDRKWVGKVRHGEKVYFLNREGDGVYIETQEGQKGWITYWFIKEF